MDYKGHPRPYEGDEKYIFISYSHQDIDKVLPIISRLTADGFRIWYDDGISPGTEWPEVIAQHLNGCNLFVAFLSNSYMDSFNCRREIDFAVRKRKTFMAVFLEETELSLGVEMQISTVQSVDYYKTTPEVFIESFCNFDVVKVSGCRAEAVYQQPMTPSYVQPQANYVQQPYIPQSVMPNQNAVIQNQNAVIQNQIPVVPTVQLTPVSSTIPVNPAVRATPVAATAPVAPAAPVTPTGSAAQAAQKAKKKNKFLLPIILGSLVLLAVAGIILGVNVSKKAGKGTKKSGAHAIELADVAVTDSVLRKEAKGKEVRQIKLENCELSVRDAAVWGDVLGENVTQITITNCRLDDATAKVILENAPALKTLNLSTNELTSISFANNIHLTEVNLCFNKITKIDISNLDELKAIRLDNNELKDLSFLQTAIHLQTLTADSNQLEKIDTLKNCALLSTVRLSNNSITDVSPLAPSKDTIRELDLSFNRISGIDIICPLPEAKKICLDNNDISTVYLTGSTKLNYLSARNNKLDTLAGDFEALSYIDVANNRLSGDYYFVKSENLSTGFFENNNISELWLPGKKYSYGKFSAYNNPLVKFDIGLEKTSYDLYLTYNDELRTTLENKNAQRLYLVDCPYDLRVNFEKVWTTYSVEFPEKNEVVDMVEELRKPM